MTNLQEKSNNSFDFHFAYSIIALVAVFPLVCFALEFLYSSQNTLSVRFFRTAIGWLCAFMIWKGSRLFRLGTAFVAISSSAIMLSSQIISIALYSLRGTLQPDWFIGISVSLYILFTGLALLLPPISRYQQAKRAVVASPKAS